MFQFTFLWGGVLVFISIFYLESEYQLGLLSLGFTVMFFSFTFLQRASYHKDDDKIERRFEELKKNQEEIKQLLEKLHHQEEHPSHHAEEKKIISLVTINFPSKKKD
jgi:low affinity Fe/Cu permease